MILIIVVAYLTFLPNYTESTFPRFPVSPDIFRNFFAEMLGRFHIICYFCSGLLIKQFKQSKQTMKKFQMMMATVLVALMAFAVQSCGSDDKDDLSSSPYEITGAVNIQQKGDLTDTDIATLKEKFAQSVTGTYMTDQMAESTTDQLVQKYIANLRELDSSKSTAVFTITITTINLKTNKQVCKWDIEWNKGSVSGKKY